MLTEGARTQARVPRTGNSGDDVAAQRFVKKAPRMEPPPAPKPAQEVKQLTRGISTTSWRNLLAAGFGMMALIAGGGAAYYVWRRRRRLVAPREPTAESYRAKAERGDAGAQCDLGFCYEVGRGVPVDRLQAAQWYRRAAEQGHGTAACNLGYCYEVGIGVAVDAQQAVEWYRRAAAQARHVTHCYSLRIPHRVTQQRPAELIISIGY